MISGIIGPFGPCGTEALVITGRFESVAILASAAACALSSGIGSKPLASALLSTLVELGRGLDTKTLQTMAKPIVEAYDWSKQGAVDQRERVSGPLIGAPRHVAVGSHQDQATLVKRADRRILSEDHRL